MSEPRATIEGVPLNFTAIDFETANSSPASACSVGLVKVRGGRVVERASWFIKPPVGHDAFLEWNTRIHGIVATDVVGAKAGPSSTATSWRSQRGTSWSRTTPASTWA